MAQEFGLVLKREQRDKVNGLKARDTDGSQVLKCYHNHHQQEVKESECIEKQDHIKNCKFSIFYCRSITLFYIIHLYIELNYINK